MARLEISSEDIQRMMVARNIVEKFEEILEEEGFEFFIEGEHMFLRTMDDNNVYRLYDKSMGDAIVARTSREKLLPADIENLKRLLGGYYSKGYWNRLVEKAREQKLCRAERANLKSLLLLLRNSLLESNFEGEK